MIEVWTASTWGRLNTAQKQAKHTVSLADCGVNMVGERQLSVQYDAEIAHPLTSFQLVSVEFIITLYRGRAESEWTPGTSCI